MRQPHRSRLSFLAALSIVALALGGCSGVGTASGVGTSASSSASAADTSPAASATGTVFDPSTVHTISMTIDPTDLKKMLQTYVDSGEKTWVKGSVTIDGTTFDDVGIKLKGNSSLRGVSATSEPQTLPWRIRLDKYVDGQNLDGYTDFTVRANSSTTSLNEAVALDLLGDAGLATEHAVQTKFSVNGGDAVLRLTIQNLDDTWVKQNFPDAGDGSILYKSDADGDWSWRGTDGDYSTSFDIESGPDDYAPLIELLNLLHNGTTAEIAEKLPQLVDLDSFATYLAFEDLIDNFDDIDGPGNNSYLFWDSSTKKFTVVAWDHNLAFGSSPTGGQGGAGGMGGIPGGGRPGAAQGGTSAGDDSAAVAPPTGAIPTGQPGGQRGPGQGGGQGQAGTGQGQGGPAGKDNPLVDAFNANTTWKALYTKALTTLKAKLITSGLLDDSVHAWVKTLTADAGGLVSTSTITSDADKILAYDK